MQNKSTFIFIYLHLLLYLYFFSVFIHLCISTFPLFFIFVWYIGRWSEHQFKVDWLPGWTKQEEIILRKSTCLKPTSHVKPGCLLVWHCCVSQWQVMICQWPTTVEPPKMEFILTVMISDEGVSHWFNTPSSTVSYKETCPPALH